MSHLSKNLIGKKALLLVLEDDGPDDVCAAINDPAFKICTGKVGSMDPQKIVVAVETAAKRSGVVSAEIYRESHALYHAILDALQGVTRGQLQLGTILRTVGLKFSVVRGNPYQEAAEGDWIAVALYGTVGAPIKGSEHETVGLGISHVQVRTQNIDNNKGSWPICMVMNLITVKIHRWFFDYFTVCGSAEIIV